MKPSPKKSKWDEAHERGQRMYPGEELWAYDSGCFGILIHATKKDPKGSFNVSTVGITLA